LTVSADSASCADVFARTQFFQGNETRPDE
jgi:hypothetical protein